MKSLIAIIMLVLFLPGCYASMDDSATLRDSNANIDLSLYDSSQLKNLTEALTLSRACELALTKNTDIWLSRQEEAIQRELKTGALLKMLPNLNAGLNYDGRDRYSASTSLDLFTGQGAELSRYSYSGDKNHLMSNFGVLWNLMDFGVSYYRFQQEKKRSVIAAHDLRRTRQRLVFQTTQAWYRCLATEKSAALAEEIKNDIDEQLKNIEIRLANGELSETDALSSRFSMKSELKNINRRLEEHQNARVELARLMGIPVGSEFVLEETVMDPGDFSFDMEELERIALRTRPELYQEDMNEQISYDEARLTFLQMLPTPTMVFRRQDDNNSLLYYSSWTNWGMDMSWNLLAIPSKIRERKAHTLRADFIKKKRMALVVAIFSQLQMGAIAHSYAKQEFELARDVSADCDRIVANMRAAVETGKARQPEVVGRKIQQLDKYSDYVNAYARLMTARASLYNAAGLDPDQNGEYPSLSASAETIAMSESEPVPAAW